MRTGYCASALRLLPALLLPTLILGCSQSGAVQEAIKPPLAKIVVDTARYRCPDLDPRVEKVFAEQFPAPPPSRQLATGATGLDDDDKRAWIDRAEHLDQRKSAAGSSLVSQYKACKGGSETASAVQ
jgi:hypothetical protein